MSEWHRVGAVLELGSGLRSRLGLGLGLELDHSTITITGLLLGGPHRSCHLSRGWVTDGGPGESVAWCGSCAAACVSICMVQQLWAACGMVRQLW